MRPLIVPQASSAAASGQTAVLIQTVPIVAASTTQRMNPGPYMVRSIAKWDTSEMAETEFSGEIDTSRNPYPHSSAATVIDSLRIDTSLFKCRKRKGGHPCPAVISDRPVLGGGKVKQLHTGFAIDFDKSYEQRR